MGLRCVLSLSPRARPVRWQRRCVSRPWSPDGRTVPNERRSFACAFDALCLTSTSHCSEPPTHERCRCGSAHPRGARVPPWWRHGGALVSRRWSQARRRRRRGGRQRIPRSRPTPSPACPQTRVLAAGTTATASYTTGWGPRRSLTSSWRARELGYVTPTRRVVQRPRCDRVGGPDGVLTRTRNPVTRPDAADRGREESASDISLWSRTHERVPWNTCRTGARTGRRYCKP